MNRRTIHIGLSPEEYAVLLRKAKEDGDATPSMWAKRALRRELDR